VLTRHNGAAADLRTGLTPIRLPKPTFKLGAGGRRFGWDSAELARHDRKTSLDVHSAETIERVPIHTDADGVVRVAGTRVTLDTIVAAFDAGATAEEISQQYSWVPLADVYSVITYYLRHKSEVCSYLTKADGHVRREAV
jgi:uncharacterized protein (DUF433 family)